VRIYPGGEGGRDGCEEVEETRMIERCVHLCTYVRPAGRVIIDA
jgi:hypothetical protein